MAITKGDIMKKILILASLLASFVYADRPFMVTEYGVDSHGIICDGMGKIRGIDKHGDGFVAVRSGPGSKYRMKDKLTKNGKYLAICEYVGNWIAVIYTDTPLETYQDKCGLVSDMSLRRHEYKGSCKTGWVYKKYIE